MNSFSLRTPRWAAGRRFVIEAAVDGDAVDAHATRLATVIQKVEISDLAVRLLERLVAILPKVQHGDLAGQIAAGQGIVAGAADVKGFDHLALVLGNQIGHRIAAAGLQLQIPRGGSRQLAQRGAVGGLLEVGECRRQEISSAGFQLTVGTRRGRSSLPRSRAASNALLSAARRGHPAARCPAIPA